MKIQFRTLLIVILLLLVGAYAGYRVILGGSEVPTSIGKDFHVEIPTGSTFDEVVDILKKGGVVKKEAIFRRIAERMSYNQDPMRSGRYKIEPGWTVIQLVRHLRGGEQAPVKVVLTTERTLEEVAEKAARFIEADSASLQALFFNEEYLRKIGYTRDNLMSVFIPNTYEVYWNLSPEAFMERMLLEHDRFWDQQGRRAKAKAMDMSPEEVYTLASIVEKETLNNGEKPTIAGTYLNRLKINMRLQADPTVVFATRDFTTKRVTNEHTSFDSPYNTYMYAGLPPGPITITSISSIDAVLNHDKNNYIYFCAIGDGSGLHAFAESYEQHLGNVRTYRQNLEARGLR
jgi:UPF0755 protein